MVVCGHFHVCVCWRWLILFFFSSRRRHTRLQGDWSSDVCSSDLLRAATGLEQTEFQDLVAGLADVIEDGSLIRLTTHHVTLTGAQRAARDRLLATLDAAGFSPPQGRDLEADSDLLRSLVQSGDLVKIGDFYLTRTRAEQARARVRERIQGAGPLTVAGIRDLLGTSRKYAVPLCEWLDATGATIRRGAER